MAGRMNSVGFTRKQKVVKRLMKGIAYHAKVLARRQLTKAEMEFARDGKVLKTLPNTTVGVDPTAVRHWNSTGYSKTGDRNVVIRKKHVHVAGRDQIVRAVKYVYDHEGKLVEKRVSGSPNVKVYHYSPPGKYRGKRQKKK